MHALVWNLMFTILIGGAVSEKTYVDLTHTMNAESPAFPGNPAFKLKIIHREQMEAGFWFEMNSMDMGEHMGTHLDVPGHFYKGGNHLAEIPVERFFGPAVILDVVKKASENPDYRTTVDDVREWESEYGKVPENAIVLMNTGWSAKHPNKVEIFGTSSLDDTTAYHFPGFHSDVVDWLVKNRNINMLGTDTPSLDYGQTTTYPVHVAIGKNDILGLENLANLSAIPQKGATLFIGALKVEDGSGIPVRVVAMVGDEPSYPAYIYIAISVVILALCLLFI